MKFLVVLTMLASTVAFANDREEMKFKCFETAQDHGHRPAYVFKVEREDHKLDVELKFPRRLELERERDCWVSRDDHGPTKHREEFEVCEGEGQRINGLIPVEIDDEEEDFEGTVFCERGLGQIFHDRHHDDM